MLFTALKLDVRGSRCEILQLILGKRPQHIHQSEEFGLVFPSTKFFPFSTSPLPPGSRPSDTLVWLLAPRYPLPKKEPSTSQLASRLHHWLRPSQVPKLCETGFSASTL